MAFRAGGQDVVTKRRQMTGISLALLGALAAGACGQKGPLYLPDQAGEIVTRPTQTPVPSESGEAPNSPQTVDSPEGAASPAPEVVVPGPDAAAGEADRKKQEAARPR
jgi:predicted small lipoprotein YifL